MVRDAKAKPLAEHGGARERAEQVDNINLTDGGTSRSYLLRRLARDGRDDLLGRIEARVAEGEAE